MAKNYDFSNITDPNLEEENDLSNLPIGLEDSQAPELTPEQVEVVNKEIELEDKYGGVAGEIQADIEGLARGVSGGVSDFVLEKAGLATSEGLRERQERAELSGVAEGVGFVAPLLLSGGTAGVAKGAGSVVSKLAAATPVALAARAGAKTSQITAKALGKILKQTGKEQVAKSIIRRTLSAGAGSAVEGAAFGLGQLLSENALGRAELSAENALSAAGTGALFGAAAGGVLGSSSVLMPKIVNNKAVDYVTKKVSNIKFFDKVKNTAKLLNVDADDLEKISPGIAEKLPNYVTDKLNLKLNTSIEKLKKANTIVRENAGVEIGKVFEQIDEVAAKSAIPILPTEESIRRALVKPLDNRLKQELAKPISQMQKAEVNLVKKRIENYNQTLAGGDAPITGKRIHELRQSLDKEAKHSSKDFTQLDLKTKIAREEADIVRGEIKHLAEKISTTGDDLGSKLSQANEDYHISTLLEKPLTKKYKTIENEKGFGSLRDNILGLAAVTGGLPDPVTGLLIANKFAQSDFKRKLTILSNIESTNQKVNKIVDKIGKSFGEVSVKKAVVPATTKVLLESKLARPLDAPSKKPKDKRQAVATVAENMLEFENNPEKLQKYIHTATAGMQDVAPNIAANIANTLTNAVQFINSKIPRSNKETGVVQFMKKAWRPSDIEVAKFERYLHAVDNPTKALEQIKSGNLSRETVEVLKHVYPNLYDEIRSKTMGYISEHAESMSYSKRLQVGILLDIPSDFSLLPQNIMGLQQQFVKEEEQKEAEIAENRAAVNTTQGGINNIDKANREQTPLQKTATRK
jgi:hypothetical protein